MTIKKIYEKYQIMPNLQTHMLRVAGVAQQICDNFTKEIDTKPIIKACLLHDIGNVVKFRFNASVFSDKWFAPKGKIYWRNVQISYRHKYGKDDHLATNKIISEIGVAKNIAELVDKIGFSNAEKIYNSKDFDLKIVSYADQRVSPTGVVSMEERYNEAKKRYAQKISDKYSPETFDHLANQNYKTEKQIFTYCKIKPEVITEAKVKKYFPQFLKLEL